MSNIAEMMSPINSNIAPIIGMSRITMKIPNAIESINPMINWFWLWNAKFETSLALCVSVNVLRTGVLLLVFVWFLTLFSVIRVVDNTAFNVSLLGRPQTARLMVVNLALNDHTLDLGVRFHSGQSAVFHKFLYLVLEYDRLFLLGDCDVDCLDLACFVEFHNSICFNCYYYYYFDGAKLRLLFELSKYFCNYFSRISNF